MLCHKNSTAVLIRANGNFKCTDFFRTFNDFRLIHPCQRAQYRQIADCIDDLNPLHGLACHLSHAFACYQCQCIILVCDHFRRTHHRTFQMNRQAIMCRVIQKVQLQFRKGNHIQPKLPCKIRNALRQINNLFLRPFACIRGAVEINALHLNAAFCHHPCCNRAVDAAGKQADCLAVAAVGQTAVGADSFGM